MSADRIDDLIDALARSVAPVRRLPPLRRQIAGVAALAALVALAVVVGLGLRAPGLAGLALDTPQLWMALGLAATGLSGVTAALAFARPGRESEGWLALALALASLLVAAVASTHVVAWTAPLAEPLWRGAEEIPCMVASVVFALPVALLVTRLAARGAPLRRFRTALVAAGGATALGTFAAHLICRTPGAWHAVLTHALEPFVGALLLVLPLFTLLRRWQTAGGR